MVAAIGPARRAATVPPIAVLTGGADARRRRVSYRARSAVPACSSPGSAPARPAWPGSARPRPPSPRWRSARSPSSSASPCSARSRSASSPSVFGWPMRKIAGVAGRLAQTNAARNPRRTATTAAALMIGLTLVTTALVVGALGEGDDRLDVRAVGQGRLLRHRRSRRRRLSRHARRRDPPVRRRRRSDGFHAGRRLASTAP